MILSYIQPSYYDTTSFLRNGVYIQLLNTTTDFYMTHPIECLFGIWLIESKISRYNDSTLLLKKGKSRYGSNSLVIN